jgi:hypothetical protein
LPGDENYASDVGEGERDDEQLHDVTSEQRFGRSRWE